MRVIVERCCGGFVGSEEGVHLGHRRGHLGLGLGGHFGGMYRRYRDGMVYGCVVCMYVCVCMCMCLGLVVYVYSPWL